MSDRRPLLAVTLTCLVAAVSYAGAVSTVALCGFVLPGVLVGAVVAAGFAAQVSITMVSARRSPIRSDNPLSYGLRPASPRSRGGGPLSSSAVSSHSGGRSWSTC